MNTLTDNVVTMSSREIADLTGKRHADVMRDIRAMLSELEIGESKFAFTYTDSQNKDRPEFRLDRDLTETLLLGYSAKARMAVIKRMREMEQALAEPRVPTTAEGFAQAFQMLANAERREAQQDAEIAAARSDIEVIKQAHTVLPKMPSDCQGIERIRVRMNEEYGLSVPVVDKIMRDSPYAPTIRVLVRNTHAEGVHNAGFSKKEVSAIFRRFVAECQHSAGNLHTHPYVTGRFKLIKK